MPTTTAFSAAAGKRRHFDAAHEAMADLLTAPSAGEIVFGPNMTSLTFQSSRVIGHELVPGDEILSPG